MDSREPKSQSERQRHLELMAANSRFEDPSVQMMRERWADEEAMEEAVEVETAED